MDKVFFIISMEWNTKVKYVLIKKDFKNYFCTITIIIIIDQQCFIFEVLCVVLYLNCIKRILNKAY